MNATAERLVDAGAVRGNARVYVMVDTYPAATASVRFPDDVPASVRLATGLSSTWDATKRFCGRISRNVALQIFRPLG